MRILVCADAHANLPALEAVLKAASGVDRKVFLGDAISYGPHPKECLDLVVEEFDLVLAGNHDLAVAADPGPPKAGDGYAWDRWTRERLTLSDLELIRGMPRCADEEWDGRRVHLTHQPPGPYVMPDIPADELAERIKAMPGEIVFVAHAHRQMDRTVDGQRSGRRPRGKTPPPGGILPRGLRAPRKRVVNPGSIGQPRDGDPRAAYAIFDRGSINFSHVEYNIARTVKDLYSLPLRREFIECWRMFVEKGIVDVSLLPSL